MALFAIPFFRSKENDIESEYTKGVLCIQKSDFYGANKHLKIAAMGGHISALYNLSIINGSGKVSPYDVDFAVDCLRKAAYGGHPKAKAQLLWIEKAEDASLRFRELMELVSPIDLHVFMMTAYKYFAALCTKYGAVDSVIAYELNGASFSDYQFILNFVKRTGVSKSIYSSELKRLEEGSAADKITDALNELSFFLTQAGYDENMRLIIRCTILGYVISKSRYADGASHLLGADKFFE